MTCEIASSILEYHRIIIELFDGALEVDPVFKKWLRFFMFEAPEIFFHLRIVERFWEMSLNKCWMFKFPLQEE